MSVKLKCAGKGLAGGGHSVATVKVPCPACNNVNRLDFEPSGTIRAVTPYQRNRRIPEPSMN